MNFKKVTLVTGHDDKGNENFFFDVDGVWYNDYEAEQSEGYMRGVVFPSVIIARFGDVELSGEQWRDLQCPIRMTQEQLDAVLENQPAAVTAYEAEFVDGFCDERLKPENEMCIIDPRTEAEKDADADWEDEQDTIRSIYKDLGVW